MVIGIQPISISDIPYVSKGVIFLKDHFYAFTKKKSPNK